MNTNPVTLRKLSQFLSVVLEKKLHPEESLRKNVYTSLAKYLDAGVFIIFIKNKLFTREKITQKRFLFKLGENIFSEIKPFEKVQKGTRGNKKKL